MSTTSWGVTAQAVTDALCAVAGPIFAATWSERRGARELTVHVSSTSGRRQLKSSIENSLRHVGVERSRVRFHAPTDLASPLSLEGLITKLDAQDIAYDPTLSLARAKALVETSHAVREALGKRVRGLFYAPLLRTYYVTLEPSLVIAGDKVKVAELAAIERAVGNAVLQFFGALECPSVRVGFGLPATNLVPVDQESTSGSKPGGVVGVVRRFWKPIAIAALFGLGTGAARAAGPAVEAPNLKVSGQFGQVIDDYSWNVQGQFTAPLGEHFGFAAEGGFGEIGGRDMFGAGGHLFTRNPDAYLLGVFGGYAESSDLNIDLVRTGAEAELYLSALTLSAKAGYQFSSALGDGAFGSIDLRWYVTDNFYVSGGAEFDKTQTKITAGTEWQPGFAALPGLAFNARGVWGQDDYHSVMGGLTYYFGTDANLKDRHRRYDPDSALLSLFQTVQQEQQRLCAQYGC